MGRNYITVREYCRKYDIPHVTIYYWAKKGKIKLDRTTYPARILDDGNPPRKNPDFHRWQYQFPEL